MDTTRRGIGFMAESNIVQSVEDSTESKILYREAIFKAYTLGTRYLPGKLQSLWTDILFRVLRRVFEPTPLNEFEKYLLQRIIEFSEHVE